MKDTDIQVTASSKQEYINTLKNNGTKRAIFVAPILTIAEITSHLLEKTNRKDSFTKSAKSCIKAYTKEHKFIGSLLLNSVGLKKLSNKFKRISNNKILAGSLILDTLISFGVMKGINNLSVNKYANKKFQD